MEYVRGPRVVIVNDDEDDVDMMQDLADYPSLQLATCV